MSDPAPPRRGAYADAGVDVAAGERAVRLMAGAVEATRRPEVLGSLGGFAGLFAPDLSRYRRPVLAAATDGVGTKLQIARQLGRHDTVGVDLVGMVVDDLVVCGAEPLFMTDYIACGRLDPERVATIVSGVAEGCRQAGCALVGGETAEHPGTMAPDDYDLAGAGVGVVDADDVLGPDRVRAGDAVIAMAASGLHANGFSLVRHLLSRSGTGLDEPLGDATLGAALLTPTRIYARDCLALAAGTDTHAFAHVTGGGLAANLARVVPAGLRAVVDRSTWRLPELLGYLAGLGGLTVDDVEETFNVGVGMLAVVDPASVGAALGLLSARGVPAWPAGTVEAADGDGPRAVLVGSHPG